MTNKSKINPYIIKISNSDKLDIFEHDAHVIFSSSSIDYPREQYGFHHFIHANMNKLERLKQFEEKKKVYLVFNAFEQTIDNYDKTINNKSLEYFNMKERIKNGEFYKLWELYMYLDLVNDKGDKFVSAHLGQNKNNIDSHIKSVSFFRDKFSSKSKSDKYYASYVDKSDKRVNILDNNIKCDLITIDYDLENNTNINTREQDGFRNILNNIIFSTKIQNKEGNLICKFTETFTGTTIKIISMLCELYKDVYIIKPMTSHLTESDKFIVCMDFKYSDKSNEFKNIMKKLDYLNKQIEQNKSDNIVNIYPSYNINHDVRDSVILTNIILSNEQYKELNLMLDFVNKELYSGDVYHSKRDEQIEANEEWIKTFFDKSLDKMKSNCENIIKRNMKVYETRLKELKSDLIKVNEQN